MCSQAPRLPTEHTITQSYTHITVRAFEQSNPKSKYDKLQRPPHIVVVGGGAAGVEVCV